MKYFLEAEVNYNYFIGIIPCIILRYPGCMNRSTKSFNEGSVRMETD